MRSCQCRSDWFHTVCLIADCKLSSVINRITISQPHQLYLILFSYQNIKSIQLLSQVVHTHFQFVKSERYCTVTNVFRLMVFNRKNNNWQKSVAGTSWGGRPRMTFNWSDVETIICVLQNNVKVTLCLIRGYIEGITPKQNHPILAIKTVPWRQPHPTAVQAWRPCPLLEPSPSHPIILV